MTSLIIGKFICEAREQKARGERSETKETGLRAAGSSRLIQKANILVLEMDSLLKPPSSVPKCNIAFRH